MSTHHSLRTARALVWKEWREQRPVALAGLALAILLPLILVAATARAPRPLDAAALAGLLPGLYLWFLWPLFAAATGASTFAGEIGDGTLGYLLSRPVSRPRVWLVKVTLAFLTSLVILAGALVVAWVVGLMAREAAGSSFAETLRVGGAANLLVVPATLLLFASSVLFSTFLSRSMNAAAAGLAAALLILAGLFALWDTLGLEPRLALTWSMIDIALAAALALLGSLLIFSRGELLRGRGMGRLVAMAGAMVVGGSGLLAIPVVAWYDQLAPSEALALDRLLSPAGDAVVLTVTSPHRQSPRIWVAHTDGSGLEHLTAAGAFDPSMAPDGRWVAYFSQGGVLGWPASGLELRIIRSDGAEERRLATLRHDRQSPGSSATSFSPDGNHIAGLMGSSLVIVPAAGGGAGDAVTVRLDDTPLTPWQLLGWSATRREVLVLSSQWREGSQSLKLEAVDGVTGAQRMIYEGKRPGLPASQRPLSGWSRVPLVAGGQLLLVDVDKDRREPIAVNACYWSPVISETADKIAYALCLGEKAAAESEIHLRNLLTGDDRILGTLPGRVSGIRPSPSWDRFVVGLSQWGDVDVRTAVLLGRDGTVRALPEGSLALGWHGRDHVVLTRSGQDPWIGLMEPDTGETRTIFPQ